VLHYDMPCLNSHFVLTYLYFFILLSFSSKATCLFVYIGHENDLVKLLDNSRTQVKTSATMFWMEAWNFNAEHWWTLRLSIRFDDNDSLSVTYTRWLFSSKLCLPAKVDWSYFHVLVFSTIVWNVSMMMFASH
jgi:hypothetical protein